MPVGSEIKGSKLKSSVNRLNLLKVLIVSSASFFQGCAISSFDSSSLFSSSSSVITSVVVQEIQKQSIQQKMVEIGCLQVEKGLLGKLNRMVASLLVLFLSNSSSASLFVFKVTLLCFLFAVILNIIHKQFSFMH